MEEEIVRLVDQIKTESNFITKAKLLRFMTVDKGVKIKDAAARLGMKESYLCHILRLNKLNDLIIDGYYSQMISISHLFIISRLHNEADMVSAYERVLSGSFTVAQTEELIREMLYKTKTAGEHMDKQEVEHLRSRIVGQYENATVKVVQTRVKSKCTIELKGSLAETTPMLRQVLEAIANPAKKE